MVHKLNVVYIHNGMLFKLTHTTTDEPRGHSAERNKPVVYSVDSNFPPIIHISGNTILPFI